MLTMLITVSDPQYFFFSADHGKKSSALVIILVVTGTIAVLLPGAVCCKYGKTIGKFYYIKFIYVKH